MQSDVTNCFSKIIQLCKKSNILKFHSVQNSLTSIHYGLLGSLLKQNIFNEWLYSSLNSTDVQMFPREILIAKESPILLQKLPSRYDTLADAAPTYFETMPFMKGKLPFGFAVYGPCIQLKKENLSVDHLQHNTLMRNLTAWNRMSIAFFCDPKKSFPWFHHWSKYRYRWWRKLSNAPSKFTMSEVTETSSGDQHLSVMMEFPWGKERLETITLLEKDVFENWLRTCSIDEYKNYSYDIMPATVICECELDVAVLAYLVNSFAEKFRLKEAKQMFQLHTKLAPYKVSFSLVNSNGDNLKKLTDVANHLLKELKTSGVTVFPCFNVESRSDKIWYSRFDEMGIPFSIILNEDCLKTGIIGLRNRDTTVQEQVHITELTSKLLRYLQIRKL